MSTTRSTRTSSFGSRWHGRDHRAARNFQGAIRVADGEVDGFGPRWRRGHGRWVRDVLVWSKAPFLYRNELVAVDRLAGERVAAPGEVKRLGDNPVVIDLSANGATLQLAIKQEHRALAVGVLGEDARANVST